jgi:TRAP-type C4-dicarboxylate transport system permease small subunit
MLKFAETLKSAQLRLAMLALFVMMMIIVCDVTMRYVFESPIHGAYDVVEVSLLVFVFHGLSACFLVRQNIVIDLIDNVVPESVTHVLVRMSDLITVGILALMIWAMIEPASQAFEYGDKKLELGLKLWILWTVAIAGLAGTLFCALGALAKPAVTSHGGERM